MMIFRASHGAVMSSWFYVASGDDESRHGYVVTGFGGGAVATTTTTTTTTGDGDVDVERGDGGTTTASGLKPPMMSVHARHGSDVSVMSYASAMSVVVPTMVEEHARVSIAVGDVIRCACSTTRGANGDDQVWAVVIKANHRVRIGPILKKKRSSKVKEYRFEFASEAAMRSAALEAALACGLNDRGDYDLSASGRRRLLVIVNPKSGKGDGVKIWETKAAVVLRAAGFEFDVKTTTGTKEATRVARSADLSKYTGIVAVGGDGTVAELFQGLGERDDAVRAMKVPIGIIPAGSGNALCKSIQSDANEFCDPVSCAVTIARGHARALDRAEIKFQDQTTKGWSSTKTTHSLLSTSWGFFSDVDIESEKFRCLGGLRFTLQAIVRIISRRMYRCKLMYETNELGETHNATHSLGPIGEPVANRPGWRVVEGEILGLWALNVPWGTETTLAAPHAKFDDGSIDLVIVRPTNRRNMLKLLLAFDAGEHVNNRAVEYIKAKSFELYPEENCSNKAGGFIAVDGEVAAQRYDPKRSQEKYGPFRCDVSRAGCQVFAPSSTL